MEELLISCEPLIKSIAKNFYNVEQEDLMQAGKIGLINAYKHYNKKSNTKFSTFAYSYIFGEMYNLSLSSRSIKTNKDSIKLLKLINNTNNYLSQKLNKIPSIKDISNYLNIDEQTIYNAYTQSLNILNIDDNNYENYTYKIYDNDTKIDIDNSINTLDEKEKELIKYRYYNDLSQSQIAKLMNMSQVSVSRQEKKTLKKLKKLITE